MEKNKIIMGLITAVVVFASAFLGCHVALKQMSTENTKKTNEVKYPSQEKTLEEENNLTTDAPSNTENKTTHNQNSSTEINKNEKQPTNSESKNKNTQTKSQSTNKPSSNTNTNTQSPVSPNKPQTNQSSSTNSGTNNKTTYSTKDKTAIATFSNIENEVDTLLKSSDTKTIKDKAKGVFISIVDFIFYDGTINGITFNELTDAGKQKVLSIASSIDTKIENKFPKYKETISQKTKNAFNKASEVIKNGANNIKNFAREKLGDAYYQEIIENKDEFVLYTKNALSIVGGIGSSLLNKGKDFLNNWYQNFKNGS